MASLADEVASISDEPLDLVGISMGGMVAEHVAIQHPHRVRSLLVACTGAFVNPAVMQERAEAAERRGMEGVVDETLERWFTAAALEAQPPHSGVELARRTLLALDRHAFADGWRAIAGHDARGRLALISAPVTCVAASDDPVGTPERVKEMADGIRGSSMVVIPGPHMIHLERPAEFGAVVADHLARLDG